MSERPKRCIVGACESPIVISRAKVTRGRGMSKRSPNTVLGRRDAVEGSAISALVRELGSMIDAARKQVASAANAALTTLYWQIGHRVRTEVLAGQRAEYGGEIVAAAGRQLETRYGRGFGEENLRRVVQFATVFPEAEIVAALRRQLTWAHLGQGPRGRAPRPAKTTWRVIDGTDPRHHRMV
jgi:hypothetical protein